MLKKRELILLRDYAEPDWKIFPNVNDWVHDSVLPNTKRRYRPDYRSESLKLIVEFDGLQHYTNPIAIDKDRKKDVFYKKLGYTVVRIPFFIQLTNSVVKQLFGIVVTEQLFDGKYPSLGYKEKNTPAFLCPAGIERMITEFQKFPEQWKVNYEKLVKDQEECGSDALIGLKYLKRVN